MARPLGSARITGPLSYYGTVRHCLPASVLCPLRVCRLGFSLWRPVSQSWLPLFAVARRSFARSTLAPEPGSRRLYAGCRLGSRQAPPRLVPRPKASSVSTSLVRLSTRHQRFTLVRLLRFSPDALSGRLFRNAHHPGRWAGAACGGLEPPPAQATPGGRPPITNAAPCRVVLLHQINLPGSCRNIRRRTHLSVVAGPRHPPAEARYDADQ